MIFKLVNYTVMGIAIFYAAEGTGLIERGRYFPTLPRMEESARDPMAWLGAVQWGVTALASSASGNGSANGYQNARSLEIPSVTSFTQRLADARQDIARGNMYR